MVSSLFHTKMIGQCPEFKYACMCVLQDDVEVSFHSAVDLSAFTIRIAQADVEKLPEILLAVSEERRDEMRQNLAHVWQRWVHSMQHCCIFPVTVTSQGHHVTPWPCCNADSRTAHTAPMHAASGSCSIEMQRSYRRAARLTASRYPCQAS